ncbi:ESX secretion-associated protein EspG [Amycolatopsis rhizosphaerae]|uniref:ESX secretion-associated protein EspG n=1 Tax=Amycolatopsis rhizosphaerae TaxID=2053003 RepID=A0A558B8S3_9PSEU|nr:ESX secretion-associated protein EspG [Amycolatopsis rhizosphaerae]TVT32893.1 ESX secretion-associated protein EspG [Amycolatopsis rhizosphaerae]
MWFEKPERFQLDQLAAMVTRATGNGLHIALAPQAMWYSDEARARFDAEVDEQSARYDRKTRGEPEFTDIAELLSTPGEARYGWYSDLTNDVRLAALVASGPRFGLIAVRESSEVYLRTFWRDHLSSVLAAILPAEVWKGQYEPFSVSRKEILDAREERFGAPRPKRTVLQAERLIGLKPYAIAELSAEMRDHQGHRRRSDPPLRVYDTDEGRWTVSVSHQFGDELLRFAPADLDDVAQSLDGLRRELG